MGGMEASMFANGSQQLQLGHSWDDGSDERDARRLAAWLTRRSRVFLMAEPLAIDDY